MTRLIFLLLVFTISCSAQTPPPVAFETDKGQVVIPPEAVRQVMQSLPPEKAAALTAYAVKIERGRDETRMMEAIDAIRAVLADTTDEERHLVVDKVEALSKDIVAAVTLRKEVARKQAEDLRRAAASASSVTSR